MLKPGHCIPLIPSIPQAMEFLKFESLEAARHMHDAYQTDTDIMRVLIHSLQVRKYPQKV